MKTTKANLAARRRLAGAVVAYGLAAVQTAGALALLAAAGPGWLTLTYLGAAALTTVLLWTE